MVARPARRRAGATRRAGWSPARTSRSAERGRGGGRPGTGSPIGGRRFDRLWVRGSVWGVRGVAPRDAVSGPVRFRERTAGQGSRVALHPARQRRGTPQGFRGGRRSPRRSGVSARRSARGFPRSGRDERGPEVSPRLVVPVGKGASRGAGEGSRNGEDVSSPLVAWQLLRPAASESAHRATLEAADLRICPPRRRASRPRAGGALARAPYDGLSSSASGRRVGWSLSSRSLRRSVSRAIPSLRAASC
jgi:hypothetical protein